MGLVFGGGFVREEMGGLEELGDGLDLWAPFVHAKVVPPNLAVWCTLEEGSFEGGIMINAEGVDVAWFTLSCDPLNPAKPFPAVAEVANALDTMRTVESSDVEVP